MGDVDPVRQHDAVRGATAPSVTIGHDVQRSTVVTAEHAARFDVDSAEIEFWFGP